MTSDSNEQSPGRIPETASSRNDGSASESAWKIAIGVVTARAITLMLGWLAEILVPVAPVPQTWFVVSRQTLLDGWLRWDAGWVLLVAKTGYMSATAVAPPGRLPLPLLPMAGRALAATGVPVELALLVLSNAASIAGIVLIVLARSGIDRASAGLVLALGPWALMAVAPIPEAFLLLALGGYLLALQHGRVTTALVVASAAWLTASCGAVLWLGALVATTRRGAWTIPNIVASAVGPVATAVVVVALARQSGRPASAVVEAFWGIRLDALGLSHWPTDLAVAPAQVLLPLVVWCLVALALAVGTVIRARAVGIDGLVVVAGSLALSTLGGPAALARGTMAAAAILIGRARIPAVAVAPAAGALAIVTALYVGWYPWTGGESAISPSRTTMSGAYPALAEPASTDPQFVGGEVQSEVSIVGWLPDQRVTDTGAPVTGAVILRVRRPTVSRWALAVRAVSADGKIVAAGDFDVGASSWSRGLSTGDRFPVRIDLPLSAATPAGAYALQAYLFELPGYAAVPLLDPDTGSPVQVSLGSAGVSKVGELESGGPPSANILVSFDSGIDLVSASARCVAAKSSCTVDLRWRTVADLADRYTVFVHIVDDAGRLLGQTDSFPLDGRLPTDLWPSGYVVTERRTVTLRSDAGAPSEARIGLYILETGRRSTITTPEQLRGSDFALVPASPE